MICTFTCFMSEKLELSAYGYDILYSNNNLDSLY